MFALQYVICIAVLRLIPYLFASLSINYDPTLTHKHTPETNTKGNNYVGDDMEWIKEEFELLTEHDFHNTECKIGTLMDDKPRLPKNIDTTWVRLVTTEDGTNKAIWGDGTYGKWTIDAPSQFFSILKESFGGLSTNSCVT